MPVLPPQLLDSHGHPYRSHDGITLPKPGKAQPVKAGRLTILDERGRPAPAPPVGVPYERLLLSGDGAGGWRSSVKLDAEQLAQVVKPGNLLDAAAFYRTEKGQPGLPWSQGMLQLETNPELEPIQARGLGADPGRFWELRDHPHVQASLARPVAVLKEAARRLVKPELPAWADDEDKAALERQWEWCQRVWHTWNDAGAERGLHRFISDVMETTPTCGFSWFELTGHVRQMTIRGESRPVLVPDIPHYRAPWSVTEWGLQREKLIFVAATFLQSQDTFGQPGPWQTIIGADRVLHIGLDFGSNYEGRSWLRAAWRMIQALEQTLRIDSLAVEINGMGTWVVNEPDPASGSPQATTKQREAVAEHLSNYEAGHMPWMLLPAGWTADLKSPGSMLPDMVPRIAALERVIMLSMNSAHQLVAVQKAGGSFAARSAAEREATAGWGMVAQEYIELPLQRLLRRFLVLNFPADAASGRIYTPKVAHGAVDEAARLERVKLLSEAFKSGVLSDPAIGAIVKRLLRVEDDEPAPQEIRDQEQAEPVADEQPQPAQAGVIAMR